MPSCSGHHDGRKILLPVAVLASADPANIAYFDAIALLDTGATCSAISPPIISALALTSYEKRHLLVATEDRLVDYFQFRIGLFADEKQTFSSAPRLPYIFDDLDGFATRTTSQFDVILGMDVLGQCDFNLSRAGGWTLTFG